jgi:hypothetical protein
MHRTSRYQALLIRCVFLLTFFASGSKVQNGLSASAYDLSQGIPAHRELVLDNVPDYSLPAYPGHDVSFTPSDPVSTVLEIASEYQNALFCYAQTVRILLESCRKSSPSADSFLHHRSLPCEFSDDDPTEIG